MIKFGTDGWRAIIARDFTFENVRIVAQAISDYLKKIKSSQKIKVVIGYDTRFLSSEFAKEVALVLSANRIKVVLSKEIIPTPLVSFHALFYKYDLGIMLTASHNPYFFNGLKIKTSDGASADKVLTDNVEKLLRKKKVKIITQEQAEKMNLLTVEDLTSSYINFVREFVDLEKIKKLNLKILIDTMYGSGNSFVEKILGQSFLKFSYLHNEINPSFGGRAPEPVEENIKQLKEKVKKENFDLGLVLDGDGDRLAVVDRDGNYFNAQVILPLLALHMIKNRKTAGGIGKTVVGSNLINEVSLDLRVPYYETPVGFKYLSKLFKDNLIAIGGEEAGGIGFAGYIPERDGTVAFLLLLEMMALEGKNFEDLIKDLYKRYNHWYYKRLAFPLEGFKKKLSLERLKIPEKLLGRKITEVSCLDGIKLITPETWLIFRKSGTEPIVRIYAEAKSKKEVDDLLIWAKKMIYAL